MFNKAETKIKRISEDGENPNQHTGVQLLADLGVRYQSGKQYLTETCKTNVDALRTDLNRANSSEEVALIKSNVADASKQLTKGPYQQFSKFVKELNVQFAGLARKGSGKGASASARGRARAPVEFQKSHTYVSLFDQYNDASVNMTDSIYEAKGGVRACYQSMASPRLYENLEKQPILKKSLARVNNALKRGSVSSVLDPLAAGKTVIKRFEEQVILATSADCRTKRSLPKEEWTKKIYEFALHGTASSCLDANWTPFGMVQANIVLSGNICFAGFKTDRIPGTSYEEKRNYILRCTIDQLDERIKDGGFFAKFVDGVSVPEGKCMIVIPSGFMIAACGSDARVLRWSVASDESDFARVRETLRMMFESFAEFRNPDTSYPQYARSLGVTGI